MVDIPLLLLAAGGSTRMGIPKPLLKWGDETLIEHRVQEMLQTGQRIVVVLGSKAEEVRPFLKKYPVEIAWNGSWEQGMGSSLACGVKELTRKFSEAEGVLVTLADQPLVSHRHLNRMIREFRTGSDQIIVSSDRSGWNGVPVLFGRHYFESLQFLGGDEGAKAIFLRYPDRVRTVLSDDPLDDLDAPEDAERLWKLSRM